MKFISWNIDSLNAALTSDSSRAILSREVIEKIIDEDADVISIQETKLPRSGPSKKHREVLEKYFPNYKYAFVTSQEPARKSYAGVMTLYKNNYEPIISYPKIDAPDTMDYEARIITLEFKEFYLSQVYTPNAGNELNRLDLRMIWDDKYRSYLKSLDMKKPIIACGDFNVAHKEIDLKHPDNNHKSAGFTDEEREGFTNLLNEGFIDTFRYIHGDVKDKYTWWAQRVKTSKINNSGWRIDYFLVSERIKEKILQSDMIDSGKRQDHTPIFLVMDM